MIQMTCLVMLLGNLVGGLLSTVLFAFEKPAAPRKYIEKPSARLFIISECLLIAFAFYFHSTVKANITSWEIGYWVATILMAPLFAFVGSQISKITFKEKLAANQRAWEKIMAKRKAQEAEKAKKASGDNKVGATLTDEDANLTKLDAGKGVGTLDGIETELTKLEGEEETFFDDSMNISGPKD